LLAEHLKVKELVNRSLHFVTIIEVPAEERVPQKVAQLEDIINKL
jgi:hypothetical protein